MTIVYILIVAAIAAAVYFLFLRKKIATSNRFDGIWKALDGLGIPKSASGFKHEFTTAGGVHIDSTVPVPAEVLLIVDEALAAMIASHRVTFPNWVNYKNVGDYAILMVEPSYTTVEDDPGSSALSITGGTTAGTCIGLNGYTAVERDYIVIAHQAQNNWTKLNYLHNAVYNEGEHCDEWANDRRIGLWFVGWQDQHPHDYAPVLAAIEAGTWQ